MPARRELCERRRQHARLGRWLSAHRGAPGRNDVLHRRVPQRQLGHGGLVSAPCGRAPPPPLATSSPFSAAGRRDVGRRALPRVRGGARGFSLPAFAAPHLYGVLVVVIERMFLSRWSTRPIHGSPTRSVPRQARRLRGGPVACCARRGRGAAFLSHSTKRTHLRTKRTHLRTDPRGSLRLPEANRSRARGGAPQGARAGGGPPGWRGRMGGDDADARGARGGAEQAGHTGVTGLGGKLSALALAGGAPVDAAAGAGVGRVLGAGAGGERDAGWERARCGAARPATLARPRGRRFSHGCVSNKNLGCVAAPLPCQKLRRVGRAAPRDGCGRRDGRCVFGSRVL